MIISKINDLLIGKTITDIRFIRGLGIVPARFEIEIKDDDSNYIIEAEVNLRFIYNGKMIMCFEDLFLDEKFEEISIKKYRSQKDIEKTLLHINIQQANKKLVGKIITKINVSNFGDVNIYFGNKFKIQFLNDTHENDSCILRIVDNNSFEKILTYNNRSVEIPKTILELKNINGDVKCLLK